MDEEWIEPIKPVFENLEAQCIKSGMLLDHAMEFTDVSAYKGRITASTAISANVMGDIYKT